VVFDPDVLEALAAHRNDNPRVFIDQVALMLVVIPIYLSIVEALAFDPIWFWLLMLLNVTIGGMTPPFGYALFAFKGVAPDTDLCTIIASTYPFIALFIIGMAIIYIFPQTATFLPAQLI
jgi:TRAP-type C4-dicarboxylate transport system permease large subunit